LSKRSRTRVGESFRGRSARTVLSADDGHDLAVVDGHDLTTDDGHDLAVDDGHDPTADDGHDLAVDDEPPRPDS
jgi:hypothetical protein